MLSPIAPVASGHARTEREPFGCMLQIAEVVGGRDARALMADYERERRPVALSAAQLAQDNYKTTLRIPAALGLDERAAAVLKSAASSRAAALLPSEWTVRPRAACFARRSGACGGKMDCAWTLGVL
mgnify:CR=1 FL=1